MRKIRNHIIQVIVTIKVMGLHSVIGGEGLNEMTRKRTGCGCVDLHTRMTTVYA